VIINLREPYQVEKKFSEALEKINGELDVLILCHGYIKHESILTTNILQWDEMMNLNVRTNFQLISLAVPFLKKQMEKDKVSIVAKVKERDQLKLRVAGGGTEQEHERLRLLSHEIEGLCKQNIVVLTSSAGETPQPGALIYSTSMSMLNMLIQCTALETAFFGIRVNGVAPGVTVTNARKKPESLGKDFDNDKFLNEASHKVPLL